MDQHAQLSFINGPLKVLACNPENFERAPQKLLSKDALTAWVVLYFCTQVMGAPIKTQQAKQRDLEKFLRFYNREVGHDHIDGWTPAVTKQFQHSLSQTLSVVT